MRSERSSELNPDSGAGGKSFRSHSPLRGDALKHGVGVRAEAVRYFEADFASKAVGRPLGIPRGTVKR